ncbi:hypothetical protein, partial [Undibacterium luofuense]|uniref:hypothetical protein n=1 Tax=Undibacterium luofuense TaxID=2828733 RepID=UPI001BAFF00B
DSAWASLCSSVWACISASSEAWLCSSLCAACSSLLMIAVLNTIAKQNTIATQISELIRLIWEEMDIVLKSADKESKLFLYGKYMRQMKFDAIFAA